MPAHFPPFLFLAGVTLCGCGTFVSMTPVNLPPHAMTPRAIASVEVFTSGPPARPHVDVALLEAEQTHSLNEQGTDLMIWRLRELAAENGCDAIVLGGVTDHQGAQPGTGWNLLDPGSTKRQATCIVYDVPRGSESAPTRAAENGCPAPPVTTPPKQP